MTVREREKERRDSLILILLIILFGFLCIILSSGWALRFAPHWRLPANMGSNLNPNDVLLTRLPSNVLQPFDPNILTLPPWFDTFLTPGATFKTSTQPPPLTVTPFMSPTRTITPVLTATQTATPTTFIPLPFFTSTQTPIPTALGPTPTATFTATPLPQVDLQITKTDGVTFYTPGGSLTYTIIVTNNGPSGVINAVVSDPRPAQITTWSWVCQSQTNGASGCDAVTNSAADFTDTVNLPNGASITYLVNAQVAVAASGNLINTASVAAPIGYTDTNFGNNSATDIDTPVPAADLQVTKTDGVELYTPGDVLTYTIVVTNNGPDGVVGAVVSDLKPAQIATWTWVCTSQNNGASGCDGAVNSAANFTDTVNLPSGASIVYTVTANTSGAATGTLTNTVTITPPIDATDPVPGNNSATDSNERLYPFPYGNIGTGKDDTITVIPSGTWVTLTFGTPLVVGGHPGWDLVYYELPNSTGIALDWVILQISDGNNWYTIFNWGDGLADTNTEIPVPLPVPPNPTNCAAEPDNCFIEGALLYNSTGVRIELDGVVPAGTYYYIRIIAPAGDLDGGTEVDGIEILP